MKARLRVEYPTDPGFELMLQQSRVIERYTIQLSYRRKPARRYCAAHVHTNASDCPDMKNERIWGRHKHRWSDLTGDECVYVPEDMQGTLLEECFYEFMEECGITFLGRWNDPPIQDELPRFR